MNELPRVVVWVGVVLSPHSNEFNFNKLKRLFYFVLEPFCRMKLVESLLPYFANFDVIYFV